MKSFERGNGLFGIYIHEIEAQKPGALSILSGQASSASMLTGGALSLLRIPESQGPNPFDQLGFAIDQQWQRAIFREWNGTGWQNYDKCGPMPLMGNSYGLTQYSQAALLSTLFGSYHWVASDGYQRLGAWIEHAALRAGR